MQLKLLLMVAASVAPLVLVSAQDLSSLSPCGVDCYNRVISSGLGCDSGDVACLCAKPDFGFGLRDCAEQACGPDDVAQVASFSTSICAATAEPAPSDPSPVVATSPPVESAAAPSPTPSPSSTQPPPAEEEEESLPSTSSLESPSPDTTSVASSDVVPLESGTATTLSTMTSPQASSAQESPADETASSEPSTDRDDSEESDSPAAALTTPAIIGIGVGAGVAAIGSGVALFMLCRRRRRDTRARSLQISEPMPGSGRDYSGGLGSVSDKNLTELETKSKRYEDMIPRQSPRSMI